MIQLQSFYRDAKTRYGLRPLTGTAGLTHEFTWVHLCEDIGNVTFLRGGELVITTGLSAMREHWLADFLAALIRRHAAALIINVGKYIRESDIPQELVERAMAAEFPIFLMPWSVHISDIMQETAAELLEQTQKDRQVERYLATLTCGEPVQPGEQAFVVNGENCARPVLLNARQKSALDELTAHGFGDAAYTLSVFTLNRALSDAEKNVLRTRWRQQLNRLGRRYQLFFEQEEILLLLAAKNANDETSSKTDAETLPVSSGAGTFHGGRSAVHTKLSALPTAHEEACAACAVATSWNSPFLSFNKLGTARLFFTHPDRSLLAQIAKERLALLHAYDEQHHAQLTETLHQYLLTGGSLQATADATFTHRNTANYRIHKIKELTNCELQTAEERFAFLLAYEISDYLNLSARPRP
ncbi:PucR family transcriptional regulator [uncultured Selenomonas sp.]|uniref:PucR family transcriptional regulator n=1 Tax=uncultured Selenomonas sp. TaxID=159275 RepID=UPI0025E925C6|nr:PucR family transcriptional regulator [uncultured Selenomonas sp.]